MLLTAEKAEIIGALFGDKSLFGFYPRYGNYNGRDYTLYKRGVIRISLGKDKEWGEHLSDLAFAAYGIKGCVSKDTREWVFRIDSARVVRDLMKWYDPTWDCHTWCVQPEILSATNEAKIGLLRGYSDADGSPVFNKSRKQPLIKIESVNYTGLRGICDIFKQLGYNSHLWRESKTRGTWGLYLTHFEDIQRFYQEIKFSITRKQSRLSEVMVLKSNSVNKKQVNS